jgi:hypothetical protein
LYTSDGNEDDQMKIYCYLSIYTGVFAQMPLIHALKDYLIKFFLGLSFIYITRIVMKEIKPKSIKSKENRIGIYYLLPSLIFTLFILDFIITINPFIKLSNNNIDKGNNNFINLIIALQDKYKFLPLMLFSVINSLSVQIIFYSTLKL